MSDVPPFDGVTRLIDIVFPGDTNHHGTLFGGAALAHMDKVAFIAAARHGHVDFVTASCQRIDFEASARVGEIVDLTGRIVRVGRRSLAVEVELFAEALLTGERRRCTRGTFNMVTAQPLPEAMGGKLPPIIVLAGGADRGPLRMAELVLPDQTSHYGSLYGGNAMAFMGKAAIVVASRACRRSIVTAATERIDFSARIFQGEVMELAAQVVDVGRTSMKVGVTLWAETLATGERRQCGTGTFVMVALGSDGRPTDVRSAVDSPG